MITRKVRYGDKVKYRGVTGKVVQILDFSSALPNLVFVIAKIGDVFIPFDATGKPVDDLERLEIIEKED